MADKVGILITKEMLDDFGPNFPEVMSSLVKGCLETVTEKSVFILRKNDHSTGSKYLTFMVDE